MTQFQYGDQIIINKHIIPYTYFFFIIWFICWQLLDKIWLETCTSEEHVCFTIRNVN